MKELTTQQKYFVSEYIKSLDCVKALKNAGYKVKNPKIYDDIYGSDHCPIGIELDFK